MPSRPPDRQTWIAFVAALLGAGCVALGVSTVEDDTLPGAADRYRIETGELESEAGCRFEYRLYEPDAAAGSTVLIGHGFLRDQATMSGLAAALARHGMRAATLDFCSMRFWNGHHARNATDLALLARALGVERPIYAGFSAGALAALLAAASDPATRGLITLDLVVQPPYGRDAVTSLDAPWLALHGPPSSCNAHLNAEPAYTAYAGRLERARHETASHCEFESPTDGLCETLCGDPDNARNDHAQRTAIIERVVGWVVDLDTPSAPLATWMSDERRQDPDR